VTTTLYRRGRVRTPDDPFATALLVDGATIAWVGSEGAADAMSADVTVELEDALLAPAFVDAHVHATSAGLALTGLDLTGSPSLSAALRTVEQAARRGHGAVLLGTGWDDSAWPEGRPPTSAELDRASYGGVVYLARTDVHSAVASSALLAACPSARGLRGFLPEGLVRAEAHSVVRRAAQETVSPGQRRLAQRATLDRAAALGIACVHECGGPDLGGEQDLLDLLDLEHGVERLGYWGELADDGRDGVERDGVERALELGAVGAGGDLFVDGALGSHTAFLQRPYVDEPGHGHSYLDSAAIAQHVAACTLSGLQAGFHAIGDAALQAVVDGLDAAAEQVGDLRACRHRVEHAELLTSDQVLGLARHGVVASVQPVFDARWGGPEGMYAGRLGAERARGMNPFAALAAAGVPLALGSDCPVTPLDPWGTVRAAVQHRTSGSGLTARAAFSAHTRGGRRAARDDDGGELLPGAPATFAVWQVSGELVVQIPDERVAGWSTDPRAAVAGLPDLDGPDPQCLRTVVRGETVHLLGP